MSLHLHRDLEHLKRELLTVGSFVEEAVHNALTALTERRADLAREVIAGDNEIDAREVAVEEDCLKILALHQPVAGDLRFIVAVLKVNNDLERMGDHAADISERAAALAGLPALPEPLDFASMGRAVRTMVRESLDAVVHLDVALAHKVSRDDEIVDELHRQNFRAIETMMARDPEVVSVGVQNLTVSRHLERIADLATNIAEDVIFTVEGRVVRHRMDEQTPKR